jgi:hypothetical protein
MPTIAKGNVELQFKFLIAKTPLNPLPNFATNPINISLLTTFMLGATIASTLMIVIPASNN